MLALFGLVFRNQVLDAFNLSVSNYRQHLLPIAPNIFGRQLFAPFEQRPLIAIAQIARPVGG